MGRCGCCLTLRRFAMAAGEVGGRRGERKKSSHTVGAVRTFLSRAGGRCVRGTGKNQRMRSPSVPSRSGFMCRVRRAATQPPARSGRTPGFGATPPTVNIPAGREASGLFPRGSNSRLGRIGVAHPSDFRTTGESCIKSRHESCFSRILQRQGLRCGQVQGSIGVWYFVQESMGPPCVSRGDRMLVQS